MLRILVSTFMILNAWPYCLGIQFDRYHNISFINKYMKKVANRYPHVTFKHLGLSASNRQINYLVITKSPNINTPAIYINGTHHGNEKASTEATLGVIDYLSRKHNNLAIDRLLKKYILRVLKRSPKSASTLLNTSCNFLLVDVCSFKINS